MTLSKIARAIGATLYGEDRAMPSVVTIDSRGAVEKALFVAIKGENHDGHDFIGSAIEKGAIAVMAEHAPNTKAQKQISFLVVNDTIEALGKLAAQHRAQCDLPVVGLTGSCGKTTVKGMIAAICEQQGKTLATKGNFNNHIGLPLSLLRLEPSYEYAVIEMGANHQGEIRYLGEIAQPDISLITNVRPAHLEGFGSIENVAKTKGEIYDILPDTGVAIINVDDRFAPLWESRLGAKRRIRFGLDNPADVYASEIQEGPFEVSFQLHLPEKTEKVHLRVPGKHSVMNALAAASVGLALAIPTEKIVAGLHAFEGVPGRLNRYEGVHQGWVIDDSYNANPGSMQAALDVLAQCQGQRILVMGDMGELGPDEERYHAQIGEYAREKGIDRLMAIGNLSQHTVSAFGEKAALYKSKSALLDALKTQLTPGSVILIKGSRSAKMEVVTQALVKKEAS